MSKPAFKQLCLKLEHDEIRLIVDNITEFLKAKELGINDIFSEDKKFNIFKHVQESDALYRNAQEIDFYFRGYNKEEFKRWFKSNGGVIEKKKPKRENSPTPKRLSALQTIEVIDDYADSVREHVLKTIEESIKKGEEIEYSIVFSKTAYNVIESITEGTYVKEKPRIFNEFILYVYVSKDFVSITADFNFDAYSIIKDWVPRDAYFDDEQFISDVIESEEHGYVMLKRDYILNNYDDFETIIDDVLAACITPYRKKEKFPVYNVIGMYKKVGKNEVELNEFPKLNI